MVDFDPSAPAIGGGLFGLPHTPEEAGVVVIPVPWEATVSYGAGTVSGPAAVLQASRQVDLLDRDTGRPYEAGIAMLDIPADVRGWSDEARALAAPVIAQGGAHGDPALEQAVTQVDELGDRMNAWVYETAQRWLAKDKLVGLLGGDHSVPFGLIRAVAEKHPGLGVLHFDAHADLRDAYEGFRWSHASIMHNVATRIPEVARIVQVGIRDYGDDEEKFIAASERRVCTHFEPDLRRKVFEGESWRRVALGIVADLPQLVHVSFDIDALDPALCPHTGTPVVGGLSFAEAVYVLRCVVESGRRIVGFDLTEVAPGPEGDEWDGNVGARVLYKEIGFALASRPR